MGISKLDKNMEMRKAERDLEWIDARTLTIEGKGWSETEDFFHRLPAKAKGVVREPVWELSRHTAGISVHFTTDSPTLAVRWDSVGVMDHMPATGVSGLDLYVRHDGKWRWLSIARSPEPMREAELFRGLPAEKREYILYLPLYATLNTLELGVPKESELEPAPPRNLKPIVFYGTSITQGGCASRPGMCYTAILGRRFDRPTINLGFSGNGIMEPEMVDLLCELDPAVYVLDNLPNMQADRVNQVSEDGLRKLRKARPDTPIILVDNILYCDAYLKSSRMERYQRANAAQFAIYEKLLSEGVKGLFYVRDGDVSLIGDDGEATVDGTHLTDLGYMRFSDALTPHLEKALGGIIH